MESHKVVVSSEGQSASWRPWYYQGVGNKNPPLRRISAESGRGGSYYFSNLSSQFGRGVFNIFKSQPNLDGGFLIAHVLKSADFGQNRCFQAQKYLKIFFALRAGDQISDFL